MSAQGGGPSTEEELGKRDRSPLCAHFHASFLPLLPTGHRGALEEGIQPQPPDPAPGAPARATGLGGEGPARAPGRAGEDAGSAGAIARYAAGCAPSRVHTRKPGAAGGPGVGAGVTLPALTPTRCEMWDRLPSASFSFSIKWSYTCPSIIEALYGFDEILNIKCLAYSMSPVSADNIIVIDEHKPDL